ncbi:MAG: S1C family serine protease [Thermoanaerobaculia bacterium]
MRIYSSLCLAAALALGAGATPGHAQADAERAETVKRVVRIGQSQDGEDTQQNRRIVRVFSAASEADARDDSSVVFIGENGPHGYSYSYGFPRRRGFLGVQLVDLTPELREHFGAPEGAGVLVSSIAEDSPAARAGLRVGDVLSGIDGKSVGTGFDLARRISEFEDGDTIALEVWRDRRVITLSATVEERERTAIDLGRFVLPDPVKLREGIKIDVGRLPEQLIEIDEEGIHDALRDLQLKWQDEGMLERFQVLGQNRIDLEERIEELEERLKELEEQLDDLPKD